MDESNPAVVCPDGHAVQGDMKFCGTCGQAAVRPDPAVLHEGTETNPAEAFDPAVQPAPTDGLALGLGRSVGRASKRTKVVAGSVALMLAACLAFVLTRSGSSEANTSDAPDEVTLGPAQVCAGTVSEWTSRIVAETISGTQGAYQEAIFTLGVSSPEMRIIGNLMGPTVQRALQTGAAAAGQWMRDEAVKLCATAYPANGVASSSNSFETAGAYSSASTSSSTTTTTAPLDPACMTRVRAAILGVANRSRSYVEFVNGGLSDYLSLDAGRRHGLTDAEMRYIDHSASNVREAVANGQTAEHAVDDPNVGQVKGICEAAHGDLHEPGD